MFFSDFLSFLKFDMKSRGIRLDKEDNMTFDVNFYFGNKNEIFLDSILG